MSNHMRPKTIGELQDKWGADVVALAVNAHWNRRPWLDESMCEENRRQFDSDYNRVFDNATSGDVVHIGEIIGHVD